MFANLQAIFAMLSFCYAKRPNHLQHTIFSSLCILQQYTKFDVHTIAMLEKLLRSRSFGTTMDHLACHQVIIFVLSKGLGLSSTVQRATPAFLGCWVLIILALVFFFQQDDHPIILDVVKHVKTGILSLPSHTT
jgi:hypothetical protein